MGLGDGPFRATDANAQLTNLTTEQAQQWVRVANMDYTRRRKLGGAPNICMDAARKKANMEFLGGERPYEK